MNPAAGAVSLRRALMTVFAALYLPALPVLAMASQAGMTFKFVRLMPFWPVAWLAVAIENQTRSWPSEIACLLPLIATLVASVCFAKQNRVTLILTAIVLATYSGIQAMAAMLLLWSMSA